MTTSRPRQPRGLGSRIALTVLPVMALLVADAYVLAPGIGDYAALRRLQSQAPLGAGPNLGIFSLGVMAWVQAYVFVELVALAVPALRRLRHGNPEGRAKLDRAARALGLVMVAFQAWGIAMSVRALAQSDIVLGTSLDVSVPVVTASLVGGACLSLLVADLVTRQGIVNGLLLLPCAGAVVAEIDAARAGYAKAVLEGSWEPRHFVIVAGVIALALFAGWAAVRRNGEASAHTKSSAYRDARALVVDPTVPVPSSSIVPYTMAASLVAVPAMLANFKLPVQGVADALMEPTAYYVVLGLVLIALTFVLTRILHRPAESEDLARRLGASVDRKAIVAAQNRALVPTLLMFALLVVAARAALLVPSYHVAVATLPVVAALVVDALRAMAVPSGFVGVWQERRALATPIVRSVLEARGIETRALGGATNALFQAFAPYAPVTICVAQENAERAEKILRHLLLGEEQPAGHAEEAPAKELTKPAWSMRTRTLALAAALLVGCGVSGLGAMKQTRVVNEEARAPAKLEVVAVTDRIDPFAGVDDSAFPPGLELRFEMVSAGMDDSGMRTTKKMYFVTVRLNEGETTEHAIARGEAFTRTIALPPGARIVWQPTVDFDPDTGKETPNGARTYVVEGEPILTNRDILEAQPSISQNGPAPEVYVAITLTPEAGERFRAATRRSINRRIAIMLDGRVDTAPVVRSEIGGGRISITMGAGDPEIQRKKAKELADGLSPR